MSLTLIPKKDVAAAVLHSGVFMMPCNLNPTVFPDARKYINPNGCKNRTDVNLMVIEFSRYACLNQNTGLHPVFYKEEE